MSAVSVPRREDDFQFAIRMAGSSDPRIRETALSVATMMSSPPTRTLGLMRNEQSPASSSPLFGLGWSALDNTDEYVPDLLWPRSIPTLDKMRTDSQLSGLYRAMTYRIRQYKFMIDPNGARDDIVQGVADDMNLDVEGQDPRPRGRQKRRFSFDKFLYHALLSLIYGHMFFNIAGEYDDGMVWRLRKLMPIMPRTIARINVASDGGLISVQQNLRRANPASWAGGFAGPEIPVDNLVGFVWEMEGANWFGRSIFRDCYRNWLVKDRLVRIDAINHERAGGVPIAEAPPGASPAEMERLNQLAQGFRVGQDSGGSVPSGTNFNLHRVGGGTDVIASIRYHDEAMARMFLHMFLQLGQTETGSRALGEAFIEYAYMAQKTIAKWFVDVVNAHVIEDWVDWNYGENEQIPLLTYIVEEDDENLAVQELVSLVEAQIITPDPELEDTLRSRFHLPPADLPQGRMAEIAAEARRREKLRVLAARDNHSLRSTGRLSGTPRLRPSGARARIRQMVRRS